jgi:hypothetical protein
MITIKTFGETFRADNGKPSGVVRHEFRSPTHWAELCSVIVDYNPYGRCPRVGLSYGSGGVNKGVSDLQVALAMSQAFAAAAAMLADLSAQGMEAA